MCDTGAGALRNPHSGTFFAAVEMTRMPMVVTDPHQRDNPIIFVNQAFLRMTGYAPEEVIGRDCRVLQGTDPDPATAAAVREAIKGRRECATEILNHRKNGSTFWNARFIARVFNPAGGIVHLRRRIPPPAGWMGSRSSI
ncbi:PAS domain-containing protein [Muricoccus radiodurans]|uniref:PAS domain-containing protein n=1 Tax=Muricoccus radiodurans TaxID=2231721 RepID=UPI003CE6E398